MADVQKTIIPYTIQRLLIDAHGRHFGDIEREIGQALSPELVADIKARSNAIQRRIANEIMPEIGRWFADLGALDEKVDRELEPYRYEPPRQKVALKK